MAFLDNSGDIILDAVLTDTGRMRLAQGNGSFKISKFALGDDEINYALYNKNHASGSAYFDLEVMQTPILEAFTNNTSNLKTKLMSLSRTNVLFMPVLKLNENDDKTYVAGADLLQDGLSLSFSRPADGGGASAKSDPGRFYIAVDEDTSQAISRKHGNNGNLNGVNFMQGFVPANISERSSMIRVDQGLDTVEMPPSLGLDSDLMETAFIVEMDYRLGRVKPTIGISNDPAPVNFIDDDNIASYYLTQEEYVNPEGPLSGHFHVTDGKEDYSASVMTDKHKTQVFEGPRGSTLHFRIQASQELQTSTYLFTQIGTSQLADASGNILGFSDGNELVAKTAGTTKTIYYIDSTVRVIGANTGYRLDIPVRYVKIA